MKSSASLNELDEVPLVAQCGASQNDSRPRLEFGPNPSWHALTLVPAHQRAVEAPARAMLGGSHKAWSWP